jgi:hypothetical protein
MKKYFLLISIFIMIVFASCSFQPSQSTVDTTPPEIISVYTNPATLYNGHPFTIYANVYDPESAVTVTFDMNNDGVFGDSNTGTYPTSGTKIIAVKATSEGGVTTNFYSLSVNSVELHLLVSYTAISSSVNGAFTIDYGITNHGNVPLRITTGGYIIYGSAHKALTDITLAKATLALGVYINPSSQLSAELDGYSAAYVPYYFDFGFTFDDGYGNGTTSYFTNGVFTIY